MSSMDPVLRWLLKAPAKLYDWRLGWLLGHRFLRLTHQGRRSGRTYRTMLEVVHRDHDSHELVVLAGLGRRADWYRNIQATAPVEVAIGRERFVPDFRTLPEGEAADRLAGYERAQPVLAPIVRLVLSRLVGWRYDGSPSARARLVAERPLVAFRPTSVRSARRS